MGAIDAPERVVGRGFRRVAVREVTDALLVPKGMVERVVGVLVDDLDLDPSSGLEDPVNLVPNGIESVDVLEHVQGQDLVHLAFDPRPRRRLEVVRHELEVVPVVLEMLVGTGCREIDIEIALAKIGSAPQIQFHLYHMSKIAEKRNMRKVTGCGADL